MHAPTTDQNPPWRTVEELLKLGYQRSRVVMMNECHAGWFRCIRTRRIGQRLLPAAHRLGVRHLAMEALSPADAKAANVSRRVPPEAQGYLAQPEMREFIEAALTLGWALIAYEANFAQEPPGLAEWEKQDWRERMQARHLIDALAQLPAEERLLVWCGNHHHSKTVVPVRPGNPDLIWGFMGHHFCTQSGLEPFTIDQGSTVRFPDMPRRPARERWLEEITPTLIALGGTAGFLSEEAPPGFALIQGMDAHVVSVDNEMEEWNPTAYATSGC
jgi:hypothetical protein